MLYSSETHSRVYAFVAKGQKKCYSCIHFRRSERLTPLVNLAVFCEQATRTSDRRDQKLTCRFCCVCVFSSWEWDEKDGYIVDEAEFSKFFQQATSNHNGFYIFLVDVDSTFNSLTLSPFLLFICLICYFDGVVSSFVWWRKWNLFRLRLLSHQNCQSLSRIWFPLEWLTVWKFQEWSHQKSGEFPGKYKHRSFDGGSLLRDPISWKILNVN